MKSAPIEFCSIDASPPVVGHKFAVLLDANDPHWADAATTAHLARTLLEAGCRYFVCFGETSAILHDRIDEVIAEHKYTGVVTTFHDDEFKEDAVDYFRDIAIRGMHVGLVVAADVERWKLLFSVNS